MAAVKPTDPSLLTINGGSSSIRFAVYQVADALERRLHGKIDRIGLSGTELTINDPPGKRQVPRRLAAADHHVTLAHPGNGAGLAAVRCGKSVDTSMGLTPTSGLVIARSVARVLRLGPIRDS